MIALCKVLVSQRSYQYLIAFNYEEHMKKLLLLAAMILLPLSLTACSSQPKNMGSTMVDAKSAEGTFSKKQRK